MRDYTEEEKEVMGHLVEAVNSFNSLEPVHPNDTFEFSMAIHAAQNILMARPGTEMGMIALDNDTGRMH